MLRETINEGLKTAMKAGDKRRVATLRMMNAAIKDRDIEARGQGRGPLSDEDLLGLFGKLVKQRQESLDIYEKAGRAELADAEREEIAIIQGFLPQAMSEAETEAAVAALIAETGASGMKDMGRVMAALKERYAGQVDTAKASALVKARLAGG